MKIIFCLILMGLSIPGSSQCKLVIKKDKSSGIETRSTRFEDIGNAGGTGLIRFMLTQNISPDTSFRLNIKILRTTTRCIDLDSKMLINTAAGVVTLNLFEQKRGNPVSYSTGSKWDHCGTQFDLYAVLNTEQTEILKYNEITGLRVYFFKSMDEFKVIYDYRDQNLYFKRVFKCFE